MHDKLVSGEGCVMGVFFSMQEMAGQRAEEEGQENGIARTGHKSEQTSFSVC